MKREESLAKSAKMLRRAGTHFPSRLPVRRKTENCVGARNAGDSER